MTQFSHQAAAVIRQHIPDFTPRIGIMLSSGYSGLVDQLTSPHCIDYNLLPGFPHTSVKGHAGKIYCGYLNHVPVICLLGRAHTYENKSYEEVKTYVRTLKLLGCEYYIATNVSGSLREDVPPGELVLIHDHINFQPGNPLAGPNDDDFGPRFPPLDTAYNSELNTLIQSAANEVDVKLHTGTYISVLGPSYETTAEINAFRMWGADVIGMSTVPEVIVANHCGLKTAVIASITNFATGMTKTSHCHDEVVAMGLKMADKMCRLIMKSVGKIPSLQRG